ncbi:MULTISPECIES: acyl carrier protein [Pseudotabrizicola]|uniref:Acyl carrier protein n=1 Tax=Pseudotabrizicola sediminis TaxID=2486418 RepID=A0ABY2KQJ8_9RHOB|nr:MULTISPECIES: acyl carrier protein [Pseudotabrizicola]TGD45069.1 acyl carrier protein [Pseudotabrizicola sediminis]TGD64995.1 acyl carrier protein [Tabrizicola sp. WMC-M-20]
MTQTAQTIIGIIAEQALLDPADLTLDTRLDQLALDSLAMVELIFALEETFDISVPFNANDPGKQDFDLSSVGAIVRAVEGLVSQKAA